MEALYHVSEEGDIRRFVPRPSPAAIPGLTEPVVFAIEEGLLHNYLLPRDCPRVTFYARPESDPADVERLLGTTTARFVVAIESGWLERALSTPLYLYELPGETFRVLDRGAGYRVSSETVEPLRVVRIPNPLAELARRDVELRVMPSLRPLREAVVASSLQFSLIRMRNARR
jgi:hypothetical protein